MKSGFVCQRGYVLPENYTDDNFVPIVRIEMTVICRPKCRWLNILTCLEVDVRPVMNVGKNLWYMVST